MATFPEGKFTIVNNETGRAVRVRLGGSEDISDYRLGTKYFQSVTETPTLELGEADNTPATVWWHNTAEDAVKRRPFSQIVSHAVGEYQNIGDFCVWMHADESDELENRFYTKRAFRNRLNDMPEDVRGRLAPLIPAEWTAIQARLRAWREHSAAGIEEARANAEAQVEAWAAEENPPSAEDLVLLRTYLLGVADGTLPHILEVREFADLPEYAQEEKLRDTPESQHKALREGLPEAMNAVVERLQLGPQSYEVMVERAGTLLPAVKERRAAAAAALIPQQDLYAWHSECAARKVEERSIRFTNMNYDTDEDKRINAAMDSYLEAAAKEGVVPPLLASESTTRLYGCGASDDAHSTYRWTYDGTHIYAADNTTVPAQQTYWTDSNGYLVGRPKGGAGQTWSIVKWTPTPPPRLDLPALAYTGFFGPLNGFFAPLSGSIGPLGALNGPIGI